MVSFIVFRFYLNEKKNSVEKDLRKSTQRRDTCMCKDPEHRTNLICSKKKKKHGWSRVNERELERNKVGETEAEEMCQMLNGMVRNLDFTQITMRRQWNISTRNASYLCH